MTNKAHSLYAVPVVPARMFVRICQLVQGVRHRMNEFCFPNIDVASAEDL